jgi:large subunit ribosomal protein L29
MSVKLDEIRGMPELEILARIEESREELFNLRFQNATGQLENFKQMGLVKKEIARLETVLAERRLDIESVPVTSEKTKKRRIGREKAVEEDAKGKRRRSKRAEAKAETEPEAELDEEAEGEEEEAE